MDLYHALSGETDFELLREAPVILHIRWGRVSKRLLCQALSQLKLQDVKVIGVVLAEADARFLDLYYGKKKAGFAVKEEGDHSL